MWRISLEPEVCMANWVLAQQGRGKQWAFPRAEPEAHGTGGRREPGLFEGPNDIQFASAAFEILTPSHNY